MKHALRKDVPADSCLREEDIRFFQEALRRLCGIDLPDSKASLIESRLRRRLGILGLSDFSEYRRFLADASEAEAEWQEVINALTTHTTEWFREFDHFRQLREEVIPQWLSRKANRPLRVWSVACSTGEEPYSLGLLLNWFRDRSGLDYEILASDVDTSVLEKARAGRYFARDLDKIPEEFRTNALALGTGQADGYFKVRSHIRDRVQFEQLNLAELPYVVSRPFDILFCRNVFIYFPPEFIEQVARGLFACANPGATLFTGHSESFSSVSVPWKFVRPSVYRKPEGR